MNTTNENSFLSRETIELALLALLTTVIIVGNGLVILSVALIRFLRSYTNNFILSLACADLIVGLVVIPIGIIYKAQDEWRLGHVICDLWHSFDILASTSSILNLCAISYDRFIAITRPLQYPIRMNHKTCRVLLIAVWFCSAAISFPCIFWWNAMQPHNTAPNQCEFPTDSVYIIISSCVSFYIPLIYMVYAYSRIFHTAMAQQRRLRRGVHVFKSQQNTADLSKNSPNEQSVLRIHRGGGVGAPRQSVCSGSSTTLPRRYLQPNKHRLIHQQSLGGLSWNGDCSDTMTPDTDLSAKNQSRKSGTRMLREHRAARTLGIVFGVFIFCWLPFFVVNIIVSVCPDCVPAANTVFDLCTMLGYLNSAMNPVIYALSLREFRRAFLLLMRGRIKDSKSKLRPVTQNQSSRTSAICVFTNQTLNAGVCIEPRLLSKNNRWKYTVSKSPLSRDSPTQGPSSIHIPSKEILLNLSASSTSPMASRSINMRCESPNEVTDRLWKSESPCSAKSRRTLFADFNFASKESTSTSLSRKYKKVTDSNSSKYIFPLRYTANDFPLSSYSLTNRVIDLKMTA